LDLREIALSARPYTWASRRETPTFEKLDRVLATVGWEEKFPLVTVRALTRAGLDHTPFLIDTGSPANVGKNNHFSFELSWLWKEGFFEMVRDTWVSLSAGDSAVDTWRNKIRCLRQYLQGWARNMSGEYKKAFFWIMQIIDELDIKAELTPLNITDRQMKKKADEDLAKLRTDQETKWAQRAKVRHIQEGGNNTKYFHLIANRKHRKKKIFQLEQDEGTIVGESNLIIFILE
jgi:hypothetical protein